MDEGLVALTVTPGRTPPLLSATLPLIEPVVDAPPPCANACVEASRQPASTATTNWNPRRFMNALLFLNTRTVQPPCASGRVSRTNTQTLCSAMKLGRLTPKIRGCNDLHAFQPETSRDNRPIIQ